MTTDTRTPAEVKENYVGYHECEAMRHLRFAGRTSADIAFMLERKEATVRRHIDGECGHP
ncbi:hypothetical protein HRTV-11_gp89 [Halorubrum virus HRTV-11]|nr:hypothetical protein HRTV-11_gp89 [Halorubrum virus HRTV-11]